MLTHLIFYVLNRENFLKLEVSFEEIRFDEMREQPAYGVRYNKIQ